MSLPWYPMFPGDFDADTGHLSLAEDGAYNRLLRLQWRAPGCKLPSDMAWIFRKAKAFTDADRAVIEAVIAEFFTRKGGKIWSARLLEEYVKSDVAHSKRAAAGSKGGSANALKTKQLAGSNALALPYQPQPQPQPEKEEEREEEEECARGEILPQAEDENPKSETAPADDLIWRILHALGFDRGQTLPKWWISPDAQMIVARWQTDLGLTPDEICQVAAANHRQHGEPARGPITLNRPMEDYAGAKRAPPLHPSPAKGHSHAISERRAFDLAIVALADQIADGSASLDDKSRDPW